MLKNILRLNFLSKYIVAYFLDYLKISQNISTSNMQHILKWNEEMAVLSMFSLISYKLSTGWCCFKLYQKGGDICIPMADSCWGLTENSKIL